MKASINPPARDHTAAFRWSAKAAEQGVPEAQVMLGDLYAAGVDTAPDPLAARHWYAEAAAQGNAAASMRLQGIGKMHEPTAETEKVEVFERTLTPPQHPTPENIAIMTMVYNERVNLPIWLRHYRRMAPGATIFVIDHASDDGSTVDLNGVHKIPIPRDKMDERDRAFFVTSLQRAFLRYYDVVIYTDCDELLAPNPAKFDSLEAHLRCNLYAYASPIGVNVIHMPDTEPPLDYTQPLLRQRRYAQFHSHLCKPLVTRTPLTWEPGFHGCENLISMRTSTYFTSNNLIRTADSDGSRPGFRDDLARHSDLMSLAVPR